MKIVSLLILLLLSAPYRIFGTELTIAVSYPENTPARGIRVQQVQMERPDPRSILLGITDENGEIKVMFEQKPNSESRHGYGAYRYVLMPENFRWEVSDLFCWSRKPPDEEEKAGMRVKPCSDYEDRMSDAKSNWSLGKLVEVGTDSRLRWEVTLKKGRNVDVTVVDQDGNPLSRKSFAVSLNLEALSHTGWGGEIPMFNVQTDGKGRFSLANVGMFLYSFDLQDPQYCAPDVRYWTGIVRGKFDQDQGRLAYHRCIGKSVTFIVTDAKTGDPISNASVNIALSYSFTTQGGPIGRTDINGEYTTKNFYTEHVREFGVSKEGYEPCMFSIEEFIPGKIYEISLSRKNSNLQFSFYSDKPDYKRGEPVKLRYEVLRMEPESMTFSKTQTVRSTESNKIMSYRDCDL
jgi:hypothetical protein